MRYYADLHIHSKYSRACSKDCDIEHLTWWARRKGISVVGTGDFTHPAWLAHLKEVLEPAEPGLYKLRADHERTLRRTMPATPPTCGHDIRFMLSVEISTIYKYGEYTRKVHHLCYVPDFAAAEEFNRRLGAIGNLGSDGRPILGLDSRDLLEILLESGQGSYLVPAHIWTPWFAVLGSKAGFNMIDECYRDLADHIFALETGLSSDPEMNWRVSGLDRYTLVSHSDAHSPPMLGREATVLDTDVDYFAIRRALETGTGFAGTVEFFPEEGKYHLDGHRKCEVRLDPPDTRAHNGQCPTCGKPVTVGVQHRVETLADRAEPARPEGAASFRNLIPLPEIVGEVVGVGPKSKRVQREIDALTAAHGPELAILDEVPLDDIARDNAMLAEAIRRLRDDQVIRDPGYDGEYGTIRLFEPDELRRERLRDTPALFDDTNLHPPPSPPTRVPATPARPVASAATETATGDTTVSDTASTVAAVTTVSGGADTSNHEAGATPEISGVLAGLDAEQRAAAAVPDGPLLIVAGPGTGKTRTVTHRVAHLVLERGVPARDCLAITFTRRAADEMTIRLDTLMGAPARDVTVATFHSLGLSVLRERHQSLDLPADFGVADAAEQHRVLTEVVGDEREARRLRTTLSRARRGGDAATDDSATDTGEVLARYVAALRGRGLVDYDDLLALAVSLLEHDHEVREEYRRRFRWVIVDEYQDVDELQYRLLRLLAPSDANLTAIGDPDQAIYAFRGADVRFFLRFQQDYPRAPVAHLTRNYRSGRHIVTGAMRAITPGTLVADRELRPMRDDDNATRWVRLHRAADERGEAAYVTRAIDQLLGGTSLHSLDSGRVDGDGDGRLSFSDIAVLYRTDTQSRVILDELGRYGFPTQKRSHDPLTARGGVVPIMRELTYVGGSASAAGDTPVVDRVRGAAEAVLGALPAPDRAERTTELHGAVELLTPLAERCGADLARFHQEVLLGAEVDALDPRADAISLLTLHAAKGLEFPVVFVVGCEDALLPLRWPGVELSDDALAEERRLCFVGMTRARDHLFLTHAARRTRHGQARETRRSPFLDTLHDAAEAVTSEHAPTRPRRPAQQISLL